MRDFPPLVTAYPTDGQPGSAPAPGAEPDTRSPARFLVWLFRQQGTLFFAGLAVSLIWMVPQTVGPWVVGRAIDAGVTTGDPSATTHWVILLAVVTVVGAASGVVYHTFVVREWLVALYGTTSLVTRKTLQLGHVLPRRIPTGEVLSVSGSDGDQFGAFTEVTTRAFSQLIAYLAVAAIVLSTSVKLGLLVLVSAPLLVVLGAPLLRPLQHWRATERSRSSHLTSLATDIVGGLRILRGIGGEETFGGNYSAQSQRAARAGVYAGTWQAAVEAVGVLLSGTFVVLLMWLGVREVAAGELTVGQLISFLGYGLFLVQPMRTFIEFAQKTTRARVSAAKAIAVLSQTAPWSAPEHPLALPHLAPIIDEASGARIEPGRLTMIVSADPEASAALADRLGRYLPHEEEASVSVSLPEELRGRRAWRERSARARRRVEQERADAERAARPWGVTAGEVDLSQVPLEAVRERILVSDATPAVFAGTLRSALDPWGRLTRDEAEAVLHTASAEDVFDAIPGGWSGELSERGRGLSGGQRQRLVLARALAADPEVLILVEPTSAVDAHTEARIAQRLRPQRAGRTTVVATGSPLLLHHADEVILLQDGRATAHGSHAELLRDSPAYRSVVVRGEAMS